MAVCGDAVARMDLAVGEEGHEAAMTATRSIPTDAPLFSWRAGDGYLRADASEGSTILKPVMTAIEWIPMAAATSA